MRNFKKKAYFFLIIALLSIITITTASAQIIVGQTDSVYNLADNFSITIKINSQKDISNFLISTLVCKDKEIELYRNPTSIKSGEQKEIKIDTMLDSFLVDGSQGECYIKVNFDVDEAKSQNFEITNYVDVSLSLDKSVINSGEVLKIEGRALKSNNNLLNGFVNIEIRELDFSFSTIVKEGVFTTNLTIPSNAKAGNYKISAKVYEKNSNGDVLNEGEKETSLRISQSLKKLDIAVSEESVNPENEFSFTILSLDQADDPYEIDTSVFIYKPDKEVFKKYLLKSGETKLIQIESDFNPGNWVIEAKAGELHKTKNFFIQEYKHLIFDLENNTFFITNKGNVPFTGPVEISIGGINEIKEIDNLKINKVKKFKLLAPDGEYEIKANYGVGKKTLGRTYLTGKAISVTDFGSNFKGNIIIMIWVIVVLAMAGVTLYYFRKIHKQKIVGKIPNINKVKFTKAQLNNQNNNSQNVIDKGEKQDTSIISLYLKNAETLSGTKSPTAQKTIDSALWKAKESGAKIYTDENFRIIVLAPILTKNKDNTQKAITVAQSIERIINEHNKRLDPKIGYGLGINVGRLIVETKNNKFKFISLDNTISTTKRISQIAQNQILISEKLHRSTIGKIRTEKLDGKNLWKIIKLAIRQHPSDRMLKTIPSTSKHISTTSTATDASLRSKKN